MDYPIEDKLMLLVAWHTPGKLPAKRKPNLVKNLTLAAITLAERQARIERLTEQNAKLIEVLEMAEKNAARWDKARRTGIAKWFNKNGERREVIVYNEYADQTIDAALTPQPENREGKE